MRVDNWTVARATFRIRFCQLQEFEKRRAKPFLEGFDNVHILAPNSN